jgi:hypothetical protein
MPESTPNEETPRTPMIVNLATNNANPDEEPEYCERPDSDGFADACDLMTEADWDADNDWLASAGWGEM